MNLKNKEDRFAAYKIIREKYCGKDTPEPQAGREGGKSGEQTFIKEKPDANKTTPGRKNVLKGSIRKTAKEIVNTKSNKKYMIRKSDIAKHPDIKTLIEDWQKENVSQLGKELSIG